MAKKRGFISPYRTYLFTDKDPVIDFTRTIFEDSGKSIKEVHEESDVSQTTLWNWFNGKTRKPQWCTMSAVLLALGKGDVNLRSLARRNGR